MTKAFRTALLAECGDCGATNTVAYLPMPIEVVAPIMKAFRCPWCGSVSHFVAANATGPMPPRPDKMGQYPDWMKRLEPPNA